MSSPRAATSVATRTRTVPALKPSRARVRSGCVRCGGFWAIWGEGPAGGGGEDLDAGAELLRRGMERSPAIYDGGPQRHGPAVGSDEVVALHGELAGGHEDQDAHGMARGREA